MSIAIVFASGKGGTGKTSIVGGVASCLAAMGSRVLCIDCDAGLRNLDIILGMSDVAVMSYMDVIESRAELSDAAVAHDQIPNLYFITAPFRAEYSQDILNGFSQLVAKAKEEYDYVILDAPAGLGAGFTLACKFADRAVIVATCDRTSLRDGDRAEAKLRALGLTGSSLVVNRVSRKLLGGFGSTIDEAMDEVGLPLLGLVPEDEKVPLAAARGKALILCENKGAAVAMLHIARRISGIRTPLMRIK